VHVGPPGSSQSSSFPRVYRNAIMGEENREGAGGVVEDDAGTEEDV
jgi:hypothetical protein